MLDYAISGLIRMGFLKPEFSNELQIDGSVVLDSVDNCQILWDSTARSYFLDDAEYLAISKWLSKEKLLNYFPNQGLEDLLIARQENVWQGQIDPNLDKLVTNNSFMFKGKYRIIEWYEINWEDAEIIYDPDTGTYQNFTLEGIKRDLFFKIHPNYIVKRMKDKIKRRWIVIPALMKFLEYGKMTDIQDRSYDFVPFFPYSYGRYAHENFGIIKNAKDLQDDHNSWANMQNTHMAKVINPGHKYKKGALVNEKQIELYSSMPGVNYIVKTSEDIDKVIRQNEIPPLPYAPEKMAQERADQLRKITGFTPNLQGIQENAQENATLLVQRVKQAQKSLYIIYMNFQRSKKRIYDKVIRLMQENYTDQRVFVIFNPEKNKSKQIAINVLDGIQIFNRINLGKYETTIESLDRNPSARHMRFLQKTEVVQTILQMFGPSLPMSPILITYLLRFWLQESDLGDINEMLTAFENILGQQAASISDSMSKQQAIQTYGQLLELAKAKTSLFEEKNKPKSNNNSADYPKKARVKIKESDYQK